MMELILQRRNVWFEIEKDSMIIRLFGGFDSRMLKYQLDKFVEIRELLPNYLFARGSEYRIFLADMLKEGS